MIARYVGAPVLGGQLLDYLAPRLGVRDLEFVEPPTQIMDGYETYIYRFRLGSRDRLAAPFRDPLIIRIYSSILGLPRLQQDVAAQRLMRLLDYPAPRPLLVEEDCDLFGGPFALVEWLPGRTLLDLIMSQPWRLISGPARLAREHARLHQFRPDGFPAAAGPFLGRRLDELRDWIETYELDGLKRGLDWLWRHRPADPQSPCILHLDFHPLNVLFDRGECSGVIDWCESDVGDRHADVATTLVLMKTAPVPIPRLWERPFAGVARWLIHRRYRRVYQRLLPLDGDKLSYYSALACLRRLGRWGTWARATPRITGSKPSAFYRLCTDRVGNLEHCFWDETGVVVSL
jgi:aminoglycoside phosphotransferase (APT) family kinase protein